MTAMFDRSIPQTVRNIVFDFGGVLIDWDPRYLYRKVFASEEEMEWFLANVCTSEWNALQDAGLPFAEGIAEAKALHPEYAAQIVMFRSRWIEMTRGEIKENTDWLRSLKSEGYGIYGLTNWSAETLPEVTGRFDFFRLFDGIVVSGEERLLKPDERIYRVLLDRYGLKPQECLFIDDNPHNIATARSLGMEARLAEATHSGVAVG